MLHQAKTCATHLVFELMTFSTYLPTTTRLSRDAPGVSSSPHQVTPYLLPTLRAALLALFTAGMYVYILYNLSPCFGRVRYQLNAERQILLYLASKHSIVILSLYNLSPCSERVLSQLAVEIKSASRRVVDRRLPPGACSSCNIVPGSVAIQGEQVVERCLLIGVAR